MSAAPPGKDPANLTIRRIRRFWKTFIRAIGAEPVIYPYRNECCGGYVSLKDKELGRKHVHRYHGERKGIRSRNADYGLSTLHVQSQKTDGR